MVSFLEYSTVVESHGLYLIAIIDSILCLFAFRRKTDIERILKNKWIAIHKKYGLWKTNIVKVSVAIILSINSSDLITTSLLLGILYCVIHEIRFIYFLFFNKKEQV